MPLLPGFLKPVSFRGADAAAYREWMTARDIVAVRFFSTLILLALLIRLIIEGHLQEEWSTEGLFYRLGGVLWMAMLFACTFPRWFARVMHPLLGVGLYGSVLLTAIGSNYTPTPLPFSSAGVWLVVLLMGMFAFRPALILLQLVLVVVLPTTVAPLVVGVRLPFLTLLPTAAITLAFALATSYAMEQHWRRAFRRDLDLAASHRELADAYTTLKEAQAQLVKAEKTAALGRMVASVAHRLNTPIGNVVAVASHAEASLARFGETVRAGTIRRADLTAFVQGITESNGIILDNAQRAAALIDMFKRLVSDTGDTPSRLEVGALLAGLRPSLEARMPSGTALSIDAPSGIAVHAQWHVMETIVGELVANAVTHGFAGGGPGTLTIRVLAADDAVELRVEDDGRGIPARHLGNVFDPFYTDGTIGGRDGLGLAIVHNAVVGPLGGAITIDSREGRGTTVTIRLPAAKAGAEPVPAAA